MLPSQQGFTEDLQASNVITPIIDLTPTAEGSQLPYELQTAIDFGGTTTISVTGTGGSDVDIITTAGFYRIRGTVAVTGTTAAFVNAFFKISDGTTTKNLYRFTKFDAATLNEYMFDTYDFTVFLRSGDKLVGSADTKAILLGSFRQIADVNGNLVNPTGYSPQ